ncbi:hypothetical protein CDAR_503791 [Caerostris darwini]|uniref:Uncharacterized protein n=1 Tax=Caerostris darwini TaxID=1538125 RepID=A0AAV4PFU5_9ARAC|nr:hypothetical protein CDAR_503791 [Caerostris darwini]
MCIPCEQVVTKVKGFGWPFLRLGICQVCPLFGSLAARFKPACQAALDGYRLLQGPLCGRKQVDWSCTQFGGGAKHPLLESFPVLSARQWSTD